MSSYNFTIWKMSNNAFVIIQIQLYDALNVFKMLKQLFSIFVFILKTHGLCDEYSISRNNTQYFK